jgi:hypothetical protein
VIYDSPMTDPTPLPSPDAPTSRFPLLMMLGGLGLGFAIGVYLGGKLATTPSDEEIEATRVAVEAGYKAGFNEGVRRHVEPFVNTNGAAAAVTVPVPDDGEAGDDAP